MKKLFLLLAFAYVALTANAQITNAWTTTIPTANLPVSTVRPTVAALESTDPVRQEFTLYLDATTYDNATGATAFAALGAAVKTEIDSNYVAEVFGINPSADVTMRTVITYVHREWDAFDYTNLATQYLADEDVFKVVGYCEWEVEAP